MAIAMDLQQVLFAPNLKHSNIFYQRQLAVYNFGIHFLADNSATMSIWNETIAGRGASEICSCLLKTLTLLPPSHPRRLIVWSDACGAQNRNWYTVAFWLYLKQYGVLDTIKHKFMVSGHSFLPADRDFALIERAKKAAKVYLPQDWEVVVSEARVKDPFTVISMEQASFKNFEVLAKALQRPKNVRIDEVQCVRVDEVGVIKVKKTLEDEWQSYTALPLVTGWLSRNYAVSHPSLKEKTTHKTVTTFLQS